MGNAVSGMPGTGDLVAVGAICSVSVMANAAAMARAVKSFPLSKSTVHFLSAMDCAVSLVGSAIYGASVLASNWVSKWLVCYGSNLAVYVTCYVGTISTCEISIIRQYSLRLARKNRSLPERKCLWISLGATALCLAYFSGTISYLAATDMPLASRVERCMGYTGNFTREEYIAMGRTNGKIGLPVSIASMVTIVSDAMLLWQIKSVVPMAEGDSSPGDGGNNVTFAVPIKATFISTMIFILYQMIPLIANNMGLSRERASITLVIFLAAIISVRCPLTALLSFMEKRDDSNKDSTAKATGTKREERQEREREFARTAREREKKMKKEMEDISKLFYKGPNKAEAEPMTTEETEEVEVAEMPAAATAVQD